MSRKSTKNQILAPNISLRFSSDRDDPLLRPRAKLEHPQDPTDYYHILSIQNNASLPQIKAAYHRALLQHHPDKQNGSNTKVVGSSRSASDPIEITLIKEAYDTLVSPGKRSQYDAASMKSKRAKIAESSGPRPAQVISLEEWASGRSLASDSEDEDGGPWRYACRCGGTYEISLAMMERGVHLVGCSSCSEAIWAGYEMEECSEAQAWRDPYL